MFKELDPHKAQEMVEEGSVNVIDIRDPGSYSAGHIPSAVSLNDTNVKEYIESADKEKPLIVLLPRYHQPWCRRIPLAKWIQRGL